MLSDIVLFFIISSGSAYASAVAGKRFEEVLPLTVFSLILVHFLSGVMGFLRLGTYIAISVSTLLYLAALITCVQKRTFRLFLKRFLTPGFAVFSVIFVIITVFNYGRLVYIWDEFSHWADVVKSMYIIDDLSTNPSANAAFASYPPAMSLFQYFAQNLNRTITGNRVFEEWRLHSAYQLAAYSLLLPFLRNTRWGTCSAIFIKGAVVFVLPAVFYSFYSGIYIDAFLGLLAGFCFAYAVLNNSKPLDNTVLTLGIAVLVLTKDVGMLFAVLAGIVFLLSTNYRCITGTGISKASTFKLFIGIVCVSTAIILPKILWDFMVESNHVNRAFSSQVDLSTFLSIIVGQDKSSYRWETYVSYLKAFVESRFAISNWGLQMSTAMVLTALLSAIWLSSARIGKNNPDRYTHLTIGKIAGMVVVLVYLAGMLMTYMFKFSTYEAPRLASYERYMGILFTMLLVYLFAIINETQEGTKGIRHNGKRAIIVLTALFVFLAPIGRVYHFFSGEYVQFGYNTRKPYMGITESALSSIEKAQAKIYFVAQEDSGFDFWVARYSMRPHLLDNGGYSWSLGPQFYEGDIWSQDISADKWREIIFTQYDYVLLYKVNDYFITSFSTLFESSASIKNGMLYAVDHDSGTLKLIEAKSPS